MSLGKKIKLLREERKWSQDDLSAKINVGGRLISRYENDKTTPSTEVVKRLAEVFEVSADYLIFDIPREKQEIKDRELLEQFKKIDRLPDKRKELIKEIIDGIILKQQLGEMVQKK